MKFFYFQWWPKRKIIVSLSCYEAIYKWCIGICSSLGSGGNSKEEGKSIKDVQNVQNVQNVLPDGGPQLVVGKKDVRLAVIDRCKKGVGSN